MGALTFLGAAGTVTGSQYLLESDHHRLLVDCGMFQGLKSLRVRNWAQLPVHPASVASVVLTHAHLDHSGLLPRLVSNGFAGRIFCTAGTADLCKLVLPDAAHLQEEDARRANKGRYSKHTPALPPSLAVLVQTSVVETAIVTRLPRTPPARTWTVTVQPGVTFEGIVKTI